MNDHEDGPPNEVPTAPPGTYEAFREADTTPPPPIDFSGMNDSEKLDWLCKTMVLVSNEIVSAHHRIAVVQAAIGQPSEPDSPPLWEVVERAGRAVHQLSGEIESFRVNFIGKGASIHELQRAEERRSSASPPDDPGM